MQSPERNWERIYASHPDHLAAGEAAIAAVYPDARNPFAHLDLAAEGLEAWTVAEVWVMAAGAGPNRYVDVTDVFDRKLAALRAHVSQTAHMDDLEGMLRGWLGMNAVAAGLADGPAGRGFRVVSRRGVSGDSCRPARPPSASRAGSSQQRRRAGPGQHQRQQRGQPRRRSDRRPAAASASAEQHRGERQPGPAAGRAAAPLGEVDGDARTARRVTAYSTASADRDEQRRRRRRRAGQVEHAADA